MYQVSMDQEIGIWDPGFLTGRSGKEKEGDVVASHDKKVTTEIMKLYNCRPELCQYSDTFEVGVIWWDELGTARTPGEVLKLMETMAMAWRPDTPEPDAPGMATEAFSVRPLNAALFSSDPWNGGQSTAQAPASAPASGKEAGSSEGMGVSHHKHCGGEVLSETIILSKRYVRVMEGDQAAQAEERKMSTIMGPGGIPVHPHSFLVSRTVDLHMCAPHHRVASVQERWAGTAGWRQEPMQVGHACTQGRGGSCVPDWALDWAELRAAAGLPLHPWIHRALVHARGTGRG